MSLPFPPLPPPTNHFPALELRVDPAHSSPVAVNLQPVQKKNSPRCLTVQPLAGEILVFASSKTCRPRCLYSHMEIESILLLQMVNSHSKDEMRPRVPANRGTVAALMRASSLGCCWGHCVQPLKMCLLHSFPMTHRVFAHLLPHTK